MKLEFAEETELRYLNLFLFFGFNYFIVKLSLDFEYWITSCFYFHSRFRRASNSHVQQRDSAQRLEFLSFAAVQALKKKNNTLDKLIIRYTKYIFKF